MHSSTILLDGHDTVGENRNAHRVEDLADCLAEFGAVDMDGIQTDVEGSLREPFAGDVVTFGAVAEPEDDVPLGGGNTAADQFIRGQANGGEKVRGGPVQRFAYRVGGGWITVEADDLHARAGEMDGGSHAGNAAADDYDFMLIFVFVLVQEADYLVDAMLIGDTHCLPVFAGYATINLSLKGSNK
jgi:hypothetical protein